MTLIRMNVTLFVLILYRRDIATYFISTLSEKLFIEVCTKYGLIPIDNMVLIDDCLISTINQYITPRLGLLYPDEAVIETNNKYDTTYNAIVLNDISLLKC